MVRRNGSFAPGIMAFSKIVEAWRAEYPHIGFTRLVVGDCPGGEGDAQTQFTQGWDPDLATKYGMVWFERRYIAGTFIDVDELVSTVNGILHSGASMSIPSVTVYPRPPVPE